MSQARILDPIQNTQPEESGWICVTSPPGRGLDKETWVNSVVLNDKEFVIFFGDQLLKYNVCRDDWMLLLKLPESLQVGPRVEGWSSISIDEDANRLYMSGEHSAMVVLELESGVIIKKLPAIRCDDDLVDGAMVNVHGSIHQVGGGGSDLIVHRTWNATQEIWNTAKGSSGLKLPGLECNTLVFVPSKNILLLIGGLCDLYDTSTAGIWRYGDATGDWEEIVGFEFDLSEGVSVLTGDEQYIVITGTKHYTQNEIVDVYVLDIRDENEYKLMMSLTRKPSPDATLVARTSSIRETNLLTSGWTRKLFTTERACGHLRRCAPA